MKDKLLLALDLDGTLLTSDLEISPDTKKRLREFQDLGHLVTIATGRPLQGALRYAIELGLIAPLILNNGALVADAQGKVHGLYPVDPHAGADILAYCRTHTLHCSFFIGNDIYMLRQNALAERLHQTYDLTVPQVAENPDKLIHQGVTNFVIILEPQRLEGVYAEIKARFASRLEVARTGAHFIDIFQPGVSKGWALQELAQELGIAPGNVIAVGDNHNDLDMLEWAGLGVAMDGADELVKGAADYVTTSNDDDGIARLVEKILDCGDHLRLASVQNK